MIKFISLISAMIILMGLTINVFALMESSGSAGENSTYTFNSSTGELIIEPAGFTLSQGNTWIIAGIAIIAIGAMAIIAKKKAC